MPVALIGIRWLRRCVWRQIGALNGESGESRSRQTRRDIPSDLCLSLLHRLLIWEMRRRTKLAEFSYRRLTVSMTTALGACLPTAGSK